MEVNKKQLADIFGASIRTIQNWQEQGMPVLRGGGKGNEVLYDSAAVIRWYAERDAEIENEKLRREVEELRQASETDLQPGTIEYERHRLTRAQADAQELKNARDSAEVVETAFCTFVLSRIAGEIASILDGIPLSVQRRFPELENRHVDFLKRDIIKAMNKAAALDELKIDLTEVGGERYFFCNEQNEKGEPVTWQRRQYQPYPIQGSGFELNGKGTSTRPTLTVSNLYGMVTGMAEDMQSLVGGTVVRRKVYARFLDAVNFVNGNSDADPEQEVISRWRIEQCSELSAVSASFVLSTPTETDGAVFPGRIMLANTCTWTYRGDECGYHGPAVADEYDQPTSDITKDKCSKCLSGCKFRNNVSNFGGFLSINKLSQ